MAKVATEFRQRFHKPVVIDMFCYRRHGHNEGDEPSFTQPKMYRRIKVHSTTAKIYTDRLVEEGLVTSGDVDKMRSDLRDHLESEFQAGQSYKPNKADWLDGAWSTISKAEEGPRRGETGVDLDTLKFLGKRITTIPKSFNPHKTLARLFKRRREMIDTGEGLDWAMGEHLAFKMITQIAAHFVGKAG